MLSLPGSISLKTWNGLPKLKGLIVKFISLNLPSVFKSKLFFKSGSEVIPTYWVLAAFILSKIFLILLFLRWIKTCLIKIKSKSSINLKSSLIKSLQINFILRHRLTCLFGKYFQKNNYIRSILMRNNYVLLFLWARNQISRHEYVTYETNFLH